MERDELAKLAALDGLAPIPPQQVAEALAGPPFIPIPSALNLRDIGLSGANKIKPGLIFRSGGLTTWPDSSKQLLATQYHITTIFDLRSEGERVRQPSPEIEGIETVWLPPTNIPERLDLQIFVANGGADGYASNYEEVARIYAPAFARVFRHIIDKPGEAFLFHCTAGKDRTGVLAALLESLAGVEESAIADDYAFSRTGYEPAREMLMGFLLSLFPGVGLDTPGFQQFCACKGEFILAFLKKVDEKWGGVEGYCESVLGLTKEEIEKVKQNIAG